MPGGQLRRDPPRGAVVGQVHDDGVDGEAWVHDPDRPGDVVEAGGVAVEQYEVASPRGETVGQRLADAAGGAGDDRGAAGEDIVVHGRPFWSGDARSIAVRNRCRGWFNPP